MIRARPRCIRSAADGPPRLVLQQAMDFEPVRGRNRPAGAAHDELSVRGNSDWFVEPKAGVAEQQISKPVAVELPVAHRPGVDVNEPRIRIPADATALHRARCPYRLL